MAAGSLMALTLATPSHKNGRVKVQVRSAHGRGEGYSTLNYPPRDDSLNAYSSATLPFDGRVCGDEVPWVVLLSVLGGGWKPPLPVTALPRRPR